MVFALIIFNSYRQMKSMKSLTENRVFFTKIDYLIPLNVISNSNTVGSFIPNPLFKVVLKVKHFAYIIIGISANTA